MISKEKAQIAFGTWSWGVGGFAGGNAVFGHHLETDDLKAVFAEAQSYGVPIFDTAYAYANGESEKILGELMADYPRSEIIVSDKFTPGMENQTLANPVLDMLEGSLKRLGTDYIDIYWIHNAADVEKWTPYLVDLVQSGKVKRVGVSNHSLEQVKRVQEILSPHGISLSAVQNHFSLLYRTSIEDGLLDYCQAQGIDFFAYMVLEQGALSGKYDEKHPLPENSMRGQTYNPLFPSLTNLLEGLRDLAATYQVSPAQIATAWAIGRGTIPILGVTKVEQVKDAVEVLNLELSPDEIARLEKLAIEAEVNTRGGWEGKA